MCRLLFKFLSILCFAAYCLNVSASTAHHHKKHALPKHNYPADSITVPYFTSVDVGDNIQLIILKSDDGALRMNNPSFEDNIMADVENQTLILRRVPEKKIKRLFAKQDNSPKFSRFPVTVRIWARNIEKITASNSARVAVNNINSYCGLTVIATDQARVLLRGNIKLQKVITCGHSFVNACWVKNFHLLIRSYGESAVVLAGFVCKLDAALCQCAKLDARFLRAQEIYIKTFDHACALVLPIQVLNGFAYNHSSVNYYKTPGFLNINSCQDANVLQMEFWN